MRCFPSSLGFAWHVRMCQSFFFQVIRSSLASSRPLRSNIMPPGQYKISCLFLLGETRTTGTVSKHQYGAHMSHVPFGHDSFLSLSNSPSPGLCIRVCQLHLRDQTRRPLKTHTRLPPQLDSSIPLSRNGTIRKPRSAQGSPREPKAPRAQGGNSIAFIQSYARR